MPDHRAGLLNNRTEVDHIVGVALGGDDRPENVRAACQSCNRGRPDGRTRGSQLRIV